MRNPGAPRTLGQREAFASYGKIPVVALIGILSFSVRPAAITWVIVAGIVDAIQGLTFRLFSHILVEVHKSLPAVADANAAPAVVFESSMVRVLAALFHGIPYPVFSTAGPDGAFCSSVDGQTVIAETSAAFAVPINQLFHPDQLFCPALAPTGSLPVASRVHGRAADKPSADGGAFQFFRLSVIFARHAVPPNRYGAGSDCGRGQPAVVALLYCKNSIEAKHGSQK